MIEALRPCGPTRQNSRFEATRNEEPRSMNMCPRNEDSINFSEERATGLGGGATKE